MDSKPVLKDGWELGEPPVCSCGRLSPGAWAFIDEGWCLGWECKDCGMATDGNRELEIEWPFSKDDFVTPTDLEELGFRVIIEEWDAWT